MKHEENSSYYPGSGLKNEKKEVVRQMQASVHLFRQRKIKQETKRKEIKEKKRKETKTTVPMD